MSTTISRTINTTNVVQRENMSLFSRRRVAWCTAESTGTLVPSSLVSKASLSQLGLWQAVWTRNSAVLWDVVEAEVPNGSINHAVRDECRKSADESASDTVIPVVMAIDSVRASDENGAKDWCEGGNQLPHCWMIVRHDLELCVEIKRQEDQAGKGSGSSATWE